MTQRDRLREARLAKGVTQQTLADYLGVPQSTIGRLEAEIYEPSLRMALKIAKALGTTVESLFDEGESTDDSAPVTQEIPMNSRSQPAYVPTGTVLMLPRPRPVLTHHPDCRWIAGCENFDEFVSVPVSTVAETVGRCSRCGGGR
jgi:putative transcriptional regulator